MFGLIDFVLGAVILILVLWLSGMIQLPYEEYRSCRDCTSVRVSTSVINPFIWPYSGTGCVDSLYVNGNFDPVGKSPSTPDHSLKTE